MSMNKDFAILMDEHAYWADKTFPAATVASVMEHLEEEWEELKAALHTAAALEEAADIVLLLNHLVRKHHGRLVDEVRKKDAVNRRRKWAEGRHVEQD